MEIKSKLNVAGISMIFFKCLSQEDYDKMPEIYKDENGKIYGKSGFTQRIKECVYRDDALIIIAA